MAFSMDIHTDLTSLAAYGIVMRLQEGLQVGPDRPGRGVEGEWRSMGESNWLLSTFRSPLRPLAVMLTRPLSLYLYL